MSLNRFEFELIDSLGTVSIIYPERTDTFFHWIQTSDCGKPCEKGDYRFQSKLNKVFKESGFYWVGEPEDSVEQLTIYHSRPDTVFLEHDSSIIKARDHLRENLLVNPQTRNLLSDTLLRIDNRVFCIFKTADVNKQTQAFDRRLVAFTSFNGTILEFHYKLLKKQYDSVLTGFYDNSMRNLMTVRLRNGG